MVFDILGFKKYLHLKLKKGINVDILHEQFSKRPLLVILGST
jgi:hypothetical protein